MTKPANIVNIAKELLELEKKATPGGWTTLPNGNVPEVYCDCCVDTVDDGKLISQSRNHIRTLCEALLGADKTLRDIGFSGGTDAGLINARNYTSACEWLNKYGGE